ncbi:MAG: hypothetical protein O7E52_16645, partial [Candidatus Poribacteria bacterium]|nr:hypothetical protein [Candidatus Poribacteria bacterium]
RPLHAARCLTVPSVRRGVSRDPRFLSAHDAIRLARQGDVEVKPIRVGIVHQIVYVAIIEG